MKKATVIFGLILLCVSLVFAVVDHGPKTTQLVLNVNGKIYNFGFTTEKLTTASTLSACSNNTEIPFSAIDAHSGQLTYTTSAEFNIFYWIYDGGKGDSSDDVNAPKYTLTLASSGALKKNSDQTKTIDYTLTIMNGQGNNLNFGETTLKTAAPATLTSVAGNIGVRDPAANGIVQGFVPVKVETNPISIEAAVSGTYTSTLTLTLTSYI